MVIPSPRSAILAGVDAMVPRLGARAAEAEALRRLPDATIDEAAACCFLGMLTPTRWGGGGSDVAPFLEATRRLATACPSSAWTLSFLALHAWLLCRFEPRLQEELFAAGRAPRTPAPLAPTGTVRTGRRRVSSERPLGVGDRHHARRVGHGGRAGSGALWRTAVQNLSDKLRQPAR